MRNNVDYQKLILASHVNEFAQRLIRSARADYRDSLSLPLDSPEVAQMMADWDKDNGIRKYFGLAYRQLVKTAEAIDETAETMAKEKEQQADVEREKFMSGIVDAIADETAKPSE
jgi:protein-disulfide isomerase